MLRIMTDWFEKRSQIRLRWQQDTRAMIEKHGDAMPITSRSVWRRLAGEYETGPVSGIERKSLLRWQGFHLLRKWT